MPQITKPNTLNKIWAAGGDRATPLDSKISSGWQIEIPPRQWFNWLDNRQDQAIAHFNQHGIPVWDDQTEYQAGKSYVQDPGNGLVYRCTVTNTGNQPALTPSHWAVAFADAAGAFSEGQADLKYLAKGFNLNDLPNKTQARTNLGVYSTSQVDSLISGTLKLTNFTGANQGTGTTGFQKLPGGLIIQWGRFMSVAGSTQTFPIAFPSVCYGVIAQNQDLAGDNEREATPYNITNTQFRVRSSSHGTRNFIYFALGR